MPAVRQGDAIWPPDLQLEHPLDGRVAVKGTQNASWRRAYFRKNTLAAQQTCR